MGMPDSLKANNRRWAERMVAGDPDFFRRLERQQTPRYLWIGCSDSRVPANEIIGLDPGEVFVHRNVANLAPPQDANYLSVLQFAVDELKIKHIMVVGHYGCGGVRAAVDGRRRGLVDHWLHPIREVYWEHRAELEAIAVDDEAEVPALHGWRREIFGEDALALKAGRIALAVRDRKPIVIRLDGDKVAPTAS